MQFYPLVLSCLLAQAVASPRLQKRWLNGDTATGTTDPDVTGDCEYWANDISATDTCAELETYFDATVAELHAWNPSLLEDYCVLIEGWSYCVEGPAVTVTAAATTLAAATATSASATTVTTTSTTTYSGGVPSPTQSGLVGTCNAYYYVKSTDTCYTIQDLYLDFTLNEFYTWNPSISTGCVGLEPGYYVCVGVTGGTSSIATATTTASVSSSSPYQPQQTGLTSKCDDYYYVNEGDDCTAGLEEFDITMAEFYAWNPAVGSDCNTMEYGYYVCVGVPATTTATTTGPSPTQTGIITNCTTYYEATANDSCWSIVTEKYAYLTEAEFLAWNPAVGSDCTGLWAGYYYCVATTTVAPMPNTIDTCTTYYLVAEGDSCYSIEQAYGISAADFVEWNPAVGSSCASLWKGYYVCVGV
ncbi:LysM domain protein [Aspergillus indologenus CBS 114.80]|uniref:LysM domain protein n=1 Tax=Aspergillus indologenus CBS 114.80 TaxID=1450541 RepID=A0A2V5IJY8_9EURO|nr:LysM domain protein [Aspergillus indologenus CBS 114.80]